MKTLREFNYLTPQTAGEAVSLLKMYKEEAQLMAGGTDLVPLMMDRFITPKYIIDIKPISSLEYVKWDEKKGLTIGALTKISSILDSDVIKEKFFSLHQAAKSFGTTQIRNMATIGGNICTSRPSADMMPPLLVFDAQVKLAGPEGEREVQLENFVTGAGENVLDGEILTEIQLPPVQRPYGTAFKKLARTAEDLAKVNGAVKIVIAGGKCKDVRIALGDVAPTPIRVKKVEEALRRQEASSKVIEKAAKRIVEDIAPITDARSNAKYRTYISQILIKRLISEAMARGDDNG